MMNILEVYNQKKKKTNLHSYYQKKYCKFFYNPFNFLLIIGQ